MIERIGNCKIIEEVGAGGMAVVYKAIQEPLGRTVGIKALKSSIAVETQFAERFEREAKFMASLQQENIINVYDFIKYGGTMFIVMEYVEGIDLYDLLDEFKRLPAEVAAIVTLQVARALNHAHFRGIIHRDIKPANIMLAKRGDIKLMDFGIARDEKLSDLTETGTGLGTPSYMSPEQILGDNLDQRTDIWSLGVVFYQMLAGKKPFIEEADRSVLQKIRLDRYVPVRKLNTKVPRTLERILGRCMEKQPQDRYQSMQALIHDLEDYLAPRVTMNYNAFIIDFLKDKNVLSGDEVSRMLPSGSPDSQKLVREDRSVLKKFGFVQAAVLAFFLFAGLLIQLTAEDPALASGRRDAANVDVRMGRLRVVAAPWARIFIDNKEVGLTPMAFPLSVPEGKHILELDNPYYQSKKMEITILPGKELKVVEELAFDSAAAEAEKTGAE